MRHALTVLIAVCCLGIFSYSQTADELIAKNIQARGGMEKMKAIKTLRITGKFEGGGGFTASVGQENQRPNLLRETLTLQGMTAVQAYDGSAGWQIQPFGGKKDPELMGEDDVRDLLLDADFDGPLVDYKEKGSTVEYMGHDVVDGDDALRLKVTLKNGDVIYDYLDPDTLYRDSPGDPAIYQGLGAGTRGGPGFLQAGGGRDVSLLDLAGTEEPSRRSNNHDSEDGSKCDHRPGGL